MLKKELIEKLKNAKYGVFNHSAVQICSWTKKALRGEGTCYKNKFYNVSTTRCMELTPTSLYCSNNCIFCWRPAQYMEKIAIEKEDDPKTIIEHLIEERKKLLSGFGGNNKVDKELLKKALDPVHYAISLSGEPTIYTKLGEMIRYLKEERKAESVFVVTNGVFPEKIQKLVDDDNLPTQLYVSLTGYDKESYIKINKPKLKDSWERFNKTLEMIKTLNTRTIIRLTLIRHLNDSEEAMKKFAELIKKAQPHFIEVKSYMHLGESRLYLKEENMFSHDEIREYSKKLAELTDFEFINEQERSIIVLLQNKNRRIDPFIIKGRENY